MKKLKFLALFFFLLLQPVVLLASDYPLHFNDNSGSETTISTQPKRVVSLVPSVTEMIVGIGAGKTIVGNTHHFAIAGTTGKPTIVGGFFSPDLNVVDTLQPDIIFYSSLQKEVIERFSEKVPCVNLHAKTIEDGFEHIELLGRIFDRQKEAEAVIVEQQRLLSLIKDKTAAIPDEKRKRTIRLMSRSELMVPGDDSFQNDFIRAAGAVAPTFGKTGNVISLSLEEWQEYNPQVIYGCGDDQQSLTILDQPGWKDVEAVKNNRIYFFPCDLTCRAASNSGSFVAWLAARIYEDEFSDLSQNVLQEQIISRTPILLNLDYVKKAEVVTSDIRDFRNKTVLLELAEPMKTISTLEGQRKDITLIGNHYFPPPSWHLGHTKGLNTLKEHTLEILDLPPQKTSLLFTGANMDNLAVIKKSFQDMTVYALVTAGVESNAVRMAEDIGLYYKPGTINMLLLANRKLSARAMTRAIISATEAKSAALNDLDIRSTYTPLVNQATGTGTDSIIVVEGRGAVVDSSGGHTKMGELIARAVYDGVQEAIRRQNTVVSNRSIFKRLKERKIELWTIAKNFSTTEKSRELSHALEKILLQQQYAEFIKTLLTVSDDYEKGLIHDLTSIDLWCQSVADQITGRKVFIETTGLEDLPLVLQKGFGALLSSANTILNHN
jgi:ABC-type Fe3+-hydroxamate transport system substrate-binding protein/adenosylcobinamide amidohydrolase